MPPVIDDTRIPVAYESLTTATAVKMTTATHKTAGARVALIGAVVDDVNWRDDGVTVAVGTAGGNLLKADTSFLYTGDIEAIEFINTTAASGALVNVNSYK